MPEATELPGQLRQRLIVIGLNRSAVEEFCSWVFSRCQGYRFVGRPEAETP